MRPSSALCSTQSARLGPAEHPERGALNNLRADQVVAAAGLVRTGETVTLSLPLSTQRVRTPRSLPSPG